MPDTYFHTCGCPIVVEIATGGAIFRAEGQSEDDAGEAAEPIDACPNCGEILLLGDLTPEPTDEWW